MRSRLRLALFGLVVLAAAGAALATARMEEPFARETPQSEFAPTATAADTTLSREREYSGVIVPAASLELAAPLDGQVVRVEAALGDEIGAGAVVVMLDDRTLRQELAMARAQLRRLDAESEMTATELAAAADVASRRVATARAVAAAVSSEQLAHALFTRQRAEHALRAARATREEQRARVVAIEQKLADTRVRAPFAAWVAARHVDPGAFVSRGAPLAKLVATSAPRVRFGVPVDGSDRLAAGALVRVRVEGSESALTARIDRIAPALDAAARLVFAEAELSERSFGQLGRRARVSLPR
jgi:multidrug efflux pump subunit AcrA (membrane-fusion protein)